MIKQIDLLKGILLACIIVISLSGFNKTLAQCNLEIDSKIEKSNSGQNSDIYLKAIRGNGSIDFYLIDLDAPQKGPIQKQTKSANELKNDFVLVFENVPPSNYTIQAIDNSKCQVSIGGVQGIKISRN